MTNDKYGTRTSRKSITEGGLESILKNFFSSRVENQGPSMSAKWRWKSGNMNPFCAARVKKRYADD
jgi:hypothetical protein